MVERRVGRQIGDNVTVHLAGPRDFAVIGVEFLVENQEAADLRARELGITGEGAIKE